MCMPCEYTTLALKPPPPQHLNTTSPQQHNGSSTTDLRLEQCVLHHLSFARHDHHVLSRLGVQRTDGNLATRIAADVDHKREARQRLLSLARHLRADLSLLLLGRVRAESGGGGGGGGGGEGVAVVAAVAAVAVAVVVAVQPVVARFEVAATALQNRAPTCSFFQSRSPGRRCRVCRGSRTPAPRLGSPPRWSPSAPPAGR